MGKERGGAGVGADGVNAEGAEDAENAESRARIWGGLGGVDAEGAS